MKENKIVTVSASYEKYKLSVKIVYKQTEDTVKKSVIDVISIKKSIKQFCKSI